MAQQVQTTLDTEQVRSIASQIENDNNNLKDLLEQTKATINALSQTWKGQAADETRSSYESFANKFFQQYYDVLDQYVKFLRTNVAAQFEDTEHVNQTLADAFK